MYNDIAIFVNLSPYIRIGQQVSYLGIHGNRPRLSGFSVRVRIGNIDKCTCDRSVIPCLNQDSVRLPGIPCRQKIKRQLHWIGFRDCLAVLCGERDALPFFQKRGQGSVHLRARPLFRPDGRRRHRTLYFRQSVPAFLISSGKILQIYDVYPSVSVQICRQACGIAALNDVHQRRSVRFVDDTVLIDIANEQYARMGCPLDIVHPSQESGHQAQGLFAPHGYLLGIYSKALCQYLQSILSLLQAKEAHEPLL